MKATKKRSVYVYRVDVIKVDAEGKGGSIFSQTVASDPTGAIGRLLNPDEKPPAKPAKEGKKP